MRRVAPDEFVRHAVASLAAGKLAPTSEPFPVDIADQIGGILRGAYLLATLHSDDMVRDGRHEELERIANAARKGGITIRDETAPMRKK